jgi:hypothetical protein
MVESLPLFFLARLVTIATLLRRYSLSPRRLLTFLLTLLSISHDLLTIQLDRGF